MGEDDDDDFGPVLPPGSMVAADERDRLEALAQTGRRPCTESTLPMQQGDQVGSTSVQQQAETPKITDWASI